ncbi:hypothetical protein [Agaricicola taiwanensis]|nr:hypothetical protein [Agaricicola taiwanensis]
MTDEAFTALYAQLVAENKKFGSRLSEEALDIAASLRSFSPPDHDESKTRLRHANAAYIAREEGRRIEASRRRAILEDKPYPLVVSSGEDGDERPPIHRQVFRIDPLGVQAILQADQYIKKYAEKYSVDEELIRSVFYIENSQGYYEIGKKITNWAGLTNPPSTSLPSNINPELWQDILPGRDLRHDLDANVEASVKLLARIMERMEDPSIEKVATLYNGLGLDTVSVYGRQVRDVYHSRPWQIWRKLKSKITDEDL